MDVKVQSLSLTFNKPDYELARMNVCKLAGHVSTRDTNVGFKGSLGSMSLTDQSPHGQMYSQRFVTTGQQALEFDIFK